MTVEAILRRKGPNVVTTTPETSIKSAAELMREKNIAALMVVKVGPHLASSPSAISSALFPCDGGAIGGKARAGHHDQPS